MDICDLSATALSGLLREGRLSAAEVLDAVLSRADQITETVNPFTVRLDDRARLAAEHADELLRRGEGGPLCGVPVTTKDSHWMAGIPSASGSRARQGFVPTETVGPIERLEAAGAVIFARTAVPEFCYFGITESAVHGRTANPWDLERTSGGSSGGAGAAVAAGAGPLSLGGDGGGSIRIPAAFCGVVGFKPTFGLVPHEPSTPGWKTLVAMGPMARSVADARLMLTAVAGFDPRDRHSLPSIPLGVRAPEPGQLRVLASEDLGFAPLDDDVRRSFRAALQRLSAAGVDVITDDPGLGSSVATWSAIAVAEARVSEAGELAEHRAELGEAALAFILAGEQISTSAVHPGAVRPGTHPPGLRRSVRTDRRIRAAHPDPGLRGLPARKPAPGPDRRGTGRLSRPRLGAVPVRRQPRRDAGLRAADGPRGRRVAGFPAGDRAALQPTGRCSPPPRRSSRVIGFAERPPDLTARRPEPAAAAGTVSGAAGVSCGCARSGTIPAGAALGTRCSRESWPAWRQWYLRDGPARRPTPDAARQALPLAHAGAGRLLGMVGRRGRCRRRVGGMLPRPARSARAGQSCSTAVLPGGEPVLARNYDYDPDLFDGVVLDTSLTGRRVIGMSDQLWGLLDGVNDAGLAAAFTFGGRREVGHGFGIPLVLRYLLETCDTVQQALDALARIPVHLAYNVALLDRSGAHATVFLRPGREPVLTGGRVSTNHQESIVWPEHAKYVRSVERLLRLHGVVREPGVDADGLVAALTSPPLRAQAYDAGFGTLYTATYRPARGSAGYDWPGSPSWQQSFDDFQEGERWIKLADGESALEHVEALGQQVLRHHQRREEAQHVAVGACGEHQQAGRMAGLGDRLRGLRVRFLGPRTDQLDGDHRAAASHVADAGVPVAQCRAAAAASSPRCAGPPRRGPARPSSAMVASAAAQATGLPL